MAEAQVTERWAGQEASAPAGSPAGRARLAAAARLEAAAVEQAYGDVAASKVHLAAAEAALGLTVCITGAQFTRNSTPFQGNFQYITR